jgi:hypothetical protein
VVLPISRSLPSNFSDGAVVKTHYGFQYFSL